eukprot:SAG11_NODE_32106_length_286_cov_0.871658_1_plen_82_part_10
MAMPATDTHCLLIVRPSGAALTLTQTPTKPAQHLLSLAARMPKTTHAWAGLRLSARDEPAVLTTEVLQIAAAGHRTLWLLAD